MQASLDFDGLCLNGNEASNYCDGLCYADEAPLSKAKHKLPYVPTDQDLEKNSLSLDATHANNKNQLDTHSLYGI